MDDLVAENRAARLVRIARARGVCPGNDFNDTTVGKIGFLQEKVYFWRARCAILGATVWCIVATSRVSIESCAIQECTPTGLEAWE